MPAPGPATPTNPQRKATTPETTSPSTALSDTNPPIYVPSIIHSKVHSIKRQRRPMG